MDKCLVDGCNKMTNRILCVNHRSTDKYYNLYKNLLNDENKCIVNGCNYIKSYNGFCVKHYYTMKRTGSPYGLARKKCDVSWCDKEVLMKTKYCGNHQTYMAKYGREPKNPNQKITKCTIGDCNNDIYCKGMCSMHYQRFIKNKTTDLIKKENKYKTCNIENCSNIVHAKGLCRKHYDSIRNKKLK